MDEKINALSEKYYELVVLDKEYLKICGIKEKSDSFTIDDVISIIEHSMKWRKNDNKEKIEKILKSENKTEIRDLLRIEDYYEDEVYELKCINEKDSERYKLANKIRRKSSKVCKEIFDLKIAS